MPLSPLTFADAVSAYAKAARGAAGGAAPSAASPAEPGQSFADLVKGAVNGAIETAEAGERASLAATTGQADIADVVTAVAEAETTLQAVVAVRDRVIDAYNTILRMPI